MKFLGQQKGNNIYVYLSLIMVVNDNKDMVLINFIVT